MTLRQQVAKNVVGVIRDAFVHILAFPVVEKCKCGGGKPYENVKKTYDWPC